MERKFGAITSSTNPEEIAARVKGMVIGASSLIILGAALFFKVDITPDTVVWLGTGLGMVAAAITFVYGCIMWVLAKLFKTE